ncbi:3-isopropylmalate dehydrogenase [Blattabacterium cuenoti]|uniref:3-isopropylmalate dehydrogenase n=1 Tax=Blattabacterium cuenoti TaxID=1653831 RepID=UPI00163D0166|nr:3-isopropylmalate dehydrogenase [Blattabacterium cuenoti]
MKKYISIIEGDGIGPEIMKQTLKVLNAITKKYNHEFHYNFLFAGGVAIEKYNVPITENTIKNCIESDSVLFSCVGDPKYDCNKIGFRPEDGILKLRKSMRLYCNIRPILFFPGINISPIKQEIINKADFIIYRELTGGIYFGKKGRSKNLRKAYDYCVYSKKEIIRIAKVAFDASLLRKKKVTLVDKANVLETSKLWRETVKEVSLDYPKVKLDYLYIDNAAIQIIKNPNNFDIILTDNMFGDILSDESSVISGSLGLLPSASIGDNKKYLFEPVHGSYPIAKGKNIANPIGCILSAAMMLDYFGMLKEKILLEKAVKMSILNKISTEDINTDNPSGTEEVGNYIEKYIFNY